jgi:hypothetical protein
MRDRVFHVCFVTPARQLIGILITRCSNERDAARCMVKWGWEISDGDNFDSDHRAGAGEP